jgi:hypothetical protein
MYIFIYIFYSILGTPKQVTGLPISGSCQELAALRRIVETSGKNTSAKMAPSTGPTGPGCKTAPPIAGLTGLANGGATTGIYKKSTKPKEATVEESDIEEDPTSTDLVASTKTENGTPVLVSPSHCTWTFEDTDGRVHVGVSCVLPSSVGTTTAHLDAKINDEGTVLRVHMFHPKSWSTMKFVNRACAAENMKSGFIQYCLDGQKKELEKLVKLSKSKSRDKILTFAEFVLPVKVEAEIVYTVPISHANQGVTTYLFVLRKQRTKDDVMLRKKAKAAHTFHDEEEEDDDDSYDSDNSVTVTTFVGGGKRMKITEW